MSDSNGKGVTLHSNGEDFAVELASGKFVPEIDPATMKPTGNAQRFRMVDAPKPLDVSQLSSHQRSALLEAMHAQVNLLTTQVNALTKAANTHDVVTVEMREEIDSLKRARLTESLRPFTARLRWILTGR